MNKPANNSTKFLVLLFIFSVFVSGCSGSATPKNSTYWPTEGWRTSTPEEQGMDPQKLEAMLSEIKDREINLRSFLIIRNGYLVSETYFGPYDQDTKHEMQSAGRSWTSALIGIAMDKGYIDTVDQRIVDFFPERTFANIDPRKEAMTLEDVLTMRTGLEWQELPGG